MVGRRLLRRIRHQGDLRGSNIHDERHEVVARITFDVVLDCGIVFAVE